MVQPATNARLSRPRACPFRNNFPQYRADVDFRRRRAQNHGPICNWFQVTIFFLPQYILLSRKAFRFCPHWRWKVLYLLAWNCLPWNSPFGTSNRGLLWIWISLIDNSKEAWKSKTNLLFWHWKHNDSQRIWLSREDDWGGSRRKIHFTRSYRLCLADVWSTRIRGTVCQSFSSYPLLPSIWLLLQKRSLPSPNC